MVPRETVDGHLPRSRYRFRESAPNSLDTFCSRSATQLGLLMFGLTVHPPFVTTWAPPLVGQGICAYRSPSLQGYANSVPNAPTSPDIFGIEIATTTLQTYILECYVRFFLFLFCLVAP
jgi:hypothetical protein